MEGYAPSAPSGDTVTVGTPDYNEMEAVGIKAIGKCAFMIVAGGLGERLGYKGIKLGVLCRLQRVESAVACSEAAQTCPGKGEDKPRLQPRVGHRRSPAD